MLKAIQTVQPNPKAHVRLEEIPRPSIGQGELLIKVKAAAINPSDVRNVQGVFPQTQFPCIPGRDFAGLVEEGPKDWIGRRVFGSASSLGFVKPGSHAQYLVISHKTVVLSPDDLTDYQLAAMGVPYTTAWEGLHTKAQVSRGETVLIIGITGAVGLAALSIARAQQCRVIGVGRRQEALDILGLDETVDTSRQNLVEVVKEMTQGKGVDIIVDTVGGSAFADHGQCLGQNGRWIVLASVGGPTVSFNVVDFYHRQAHMLGVDSLAFEPPKSQQILAALVQTVDHQALLQPELHPVPLESAPEIYQAIAEGKERRKVILCPWGVGN
ncbi:MAG: oxidoreductase [Sulfobacillus thermosulfidooxidans]|nr:MAG: oxidoreductase [Sulfobacillus thermosulfidooxidans]